MWCLTAALLLSGAARGQGAEEGYADITVQLSVPGIGSAELSAVIREESGEAYLPLEPLFDLLKIPHAVVPSGDTVTSTGIGTALPAFVVDVEGGVVWFGRRPVYLPKKAFLRRPDGLYLAAGAWGRTFGLDCDFRFRSLSVAMTPRVELPAVREQRLTEARQAVRSSGVALTADTTVYRRMPLLGFGAADWSAMTSRLTNGATDTRLGLGVGFAALRGETVVSLAWSKGRGWDPRQQFYLWRHVTPEGSLVRQVVVGKIFTPRTASIFAPVVGVQITNTPPVQRRAFSTYTISNTTRPNWTVELYVNGVLLDYKVADSTGFYSFEVPLAYGATAIKLRFYGPYGQELIKEETVDIPFNFLPKGTLDYTLNAGVVEGGQGTRFARASAAYGLSRGVTMGLGAEHLSSLGPKRAMPFATASVRIRQNLLFSGEYALGVRRRGVLSWGSSAHGLVEASYTKFDAGQTTVITNFIEERRLSFSAPLRTGRVGLFSRLTIADAVLPGTRLRSAEWMVSGAVLGVNTNLTSYAALRPEGGAYAYSNLQLGLRLPKGLLLTPQLQYNYTQHEVVATKCLLEKPVFRTGFLSAGYEHNHRSKAGTFTVGFRYDCSFAQTAFAVAGGKAGRVYTLSSRGSLTYDEASRRFSYSARGGVGRGGILLQPFLDLNCNGLREADEPAAPGYRLRATGGRVTYNAADTTVTISDLEPYTACVVQAQPGCFEQVAWKARTGGVAVTVAPSHTTAVPVPVAVVGEVSGTVYLTPATGGRKRGQGRIVVCIADAAGTIVGKTLTEDDGYFSFLGLPPGAYTATVECSQLERLGLAADKPAVPLIIHRKYEGDVVSGVQFSLTGTGMAKAALK